VRSATLSIQVEYCCDFFWRSQCECYVQEGFAEVYGMLLFLMVVKDF